MLRALRHQYPEAVYHVMARGDGGKAIFEEDADGKAFLFRLGQVCASHVIGVRSEWHEFKAVYC